MEDCRNGRRCGKRHMQEFRSGGPPAFRLRRYFGLCPRDPIRHNPEMIVRRHGRDGSVGEYAFHAPSAAIPQAITAAKVAVGHKWSERELIFQTTRRATRPVHAYGLSFLDCALWDLAGKVQNTSLTEMLGGHRSEIPAYASCHNGDRFDNLPSKEAVSDFFLSLKEKGFRGFKMHSWHEGDKWEESANVEFMRNTLGERTELM